MGASRRYKDQYWYSKFIKQTARVVKSIRDLEGITQADLAKEILTSQSAISDIEKGDTDIQLTTLLRYAEACGCDVEILIRRKKGANPQAQWILTGEGVLTDDD